MPFFKHTLRDEWAGWAIPREAEKRGMTKLAVVGPLHETQAA
jgi:hypothetical protein